jgi:hypothetical protein
MFQNGAVLHNLTFIFGTKSQMIPMQILQNKNVRYEAALGLEFVLTQTIFINQHYIYTYLYFCSFHTLLYTVL